MLYCFVFFIKVCLFNPSSPYFVPFWAWMLLQCMSEFLSPYIQWKKKTVHSVFRIQTTGLGGMKPNTVILGWPYRWRQSEDDKTWQVFLQTVRSVAAARMALLVPKGINFFPDSSEKVLLSLLLVVIICPCTLSLSSIYLSSFSSSL
jgi:hypothetical protein